MPDQATSLRELKRFIDTLAPEPTPTPEAFLANIQTPSPFLSLAIVVPDNIPSAIFPFRQWVTAIPLSHAQLPTIWDQAGTLPASVLVPERDDHMPQIIKVDSPIGQLSVIPRQAPPTLIQRRLVPEKIRFLRRTQKLLDATKELWITLPMTEFRQHLPLLHASDAAIVLIPARPDAVLRCYEAVKAIHLSGYFFPIALSEILSEGTQTSPEHPSERIKLVAKRFLSLDLKPIMMVRSSIDLENAAGHLGRHSQLSSSVHISDFFRVFFERILYPAPEDRA